MLSDAIADQVVRLRKMHGMSSAALAGECQRRGHPDMTAAVLMNIESGRRDRTGRRRRQISVDELAVLAEALAVDSADLMRGAFTAEAVIGAVESLAGKATR